MANSVTNLIWSYLGLYTLCHALSVKSFNVNYSGHGGLQSWATESIFANPDVANLDNSGKYPFVISMSCLTGNFGFVSASKGEEPSLAEVLLQADAEGAVAALMPTAMTTTAGQHILNTALFEAFFSDDIRELGPAIMCIAPAPRQVLTAKSTPSLSRARSLSTPAVL